MNVDKLNDIIKKFKMPGLDMKQVFEIDGYLFLLSTDTRQCYLKIVSLTIQVL